MTLALTPVELNHIVDRLAPDLRSAATCGSVRCRSCRHGNVRDQRERRHRAHRRGQRITLGA